MDRRILLQTLTGRLAGITQIQGTEPQLLDMFENKALPAFVEIATEEGRSASMVRATSRWVLYRENRPPGGDDSPMEFHPEQQ